MNLLVYCLKYLIQHYLLLCRLSKNDFELHSIKIHLNAAHIRIYLIGKWNILIVPWAFLNYFADSHIKPSNCIILFFLFTFFLSIKLVIYDPLCLISASCSILLQCYLQQWVRKLRFLMFSWQIECVCASIVTCIDS